jgi:hypothetical protein
MNIPNLIVFSLYILTTIVLLSFTIKFYVQRKKIFALYIQSELDKHLIYQKLEEVSRELSAKDLAETDGFVKFISQSRDWAFEYIEDVQTALSEFDKTVDPLLKWAMRFGILNGETAHTKILSEISEAYDKLKSVLPENTETPNN